jgi:hypothetical protein
LTFFNSFIAIACLVLDPPLTSFPRLLLETELNPDYSAVALMLERLLSIKRLPALFCLKLINFFYACIGK